jgi:ABC-type glycerol-3-phosphate transport system substrate-binding protein
MAKQISKDIDGDGQYTDADLYGFVGELDWMFVNAMYACDQHVMRRESDGHYILDLNTSKTQTIVDKFYDLLFVGNQSYPYLYGAKDTGKDYIPFDSGRALFYMNVPGYVKELRATEFDFGILPYPKYDENQEKYINLNWAGTICAPLNISNPEKVGAVVEYLGAKSHEIVLPTYFDILLNGKLTRDDESREMLEIIYGDSIYDFGLNFSAFNDLLYVVPKLLQSKSVDLTSFYEKRADKIQQQYDKIYDAFIANSEFE